MIKCLARMSLIPVVVLMSSVVFAAGGFVVDDLLVTSNQAIVLSDSFDSGSLAGWIANNAELQLTQARPPRYSLFLNALASGPTTKIEREMPLNNPGKVEVSAWVYLPPEEQQRNWTGNRCDYAGFVIYTGQNMPNRQEVSVSLYLSPKNKGYLASVRYHDYSRRSGDVLSLSRKPVLDGGRWARATMVMDPGKATVTMLIDGQMACRISYVPEKFRSITGIRVYSQLGG